MNVHIDEQLLAEATRNTGQTPEVILGEIEAMAQAHLRSLITRVEPCPLDHTPNKLTAKTLRESREGKNLTTYTSLESMWADLGI